MIFESSSLRGIRDDPTTGANTSFLVQNYPLRLHRKLLRRQIFHDGQASWTAPESDLRTQGHLPDDINIHPFVELLCTVVVREIEPGDIVIVHFARVRELHHFSQLVRQHLFYSRHEHFWYLASPEKVSLCVSALLGGHTSFGVRVAHETVDFTEIMFQSFDMQGSLIKDLYNAEEYVTIL